jgi:hypothetical protein
VPDPRPDPESLRALAASYRTQAKGLDALASVSPAAATVARDLRAEADRLDRFASEYERLSNRILEALGATASRASLPGSGARPLRKIRTMSTAHVPEPTGREKAVLAMARKNTKRHGDHPFMRWVVTSEWKTASRWAQAHKLYRGTPNAWMASGKARRSCPDVWRNKIADESGGAVPPDCWDE